VKGLLPLLLALILVPLAGKAKPLRVAVYWPA
jgi:hypothetical protein